MRGALRAFALLAVLLLAGCSSPAVPPAPEVSELRLLALDGRWPFEADRALALLEAARAPAPVGALVLGEAMGARVLDYAGLDEGAARAWNVTLPGAGEAIVRAGLGLTTGDAIPLRSHAWPTPYVATYFEMERTPECDAHAAAKLCSLPSLVEGETRLRLRVDEGARDGGFLPDLVELGPGGRPAYWNGTFVGPNGEAHAFTAIASLEGELTAGDVRAPMAQGDWTVTFHIEAQGRRLPSGAAGIVRVREPGYLWFDDRLQEVTDAAAQARAVLANATPTSAMLRVAQVADALPLGVDVLVPMDAARELAGTDDITALLVELTPTQQAALRAPRTADGPTLALRARALPGAPTAPAPASAGALVFAAPFDIDLAELPAIEGAGAPSLALAGRPPIGEPTILDGETLDGRILWLAQADGPASWGLPDGGRWTRVEDALENLSRSRTLALGSPDLVQGAFATARIQLGSGNVTRNVVAIGGVTDGPDRALWTSAAMVAGAMQPVAPRVLLPLAPGADRAAVQASAIEAWGPLGLSFDR